MFRVIVLMFFSSLVFASTNIDELSKRNEVDISKPGGNEFEIKAISVFWGNPHFMMKCLPPNSPIHPSFDIYFEITPGGKMGNIYFSKNTDITECIKKYVINKEFPKPIKEFVVHIELNFTK